MTARKLDNQKRVAVKTYYPNMLYGLQRIPQIEILKEEPIPGSDLKHRILLSFHSEEQAKKMASFIRSLP
jgi:hypothetical protein